MTANGPGRGWRGNRDTCKNGHPFEGDNFYIGPRGRMCRKCARDRVIAMRHRDLEGYLRRKREAAALDRALHKKVFGVTSKSRIKDARP